MRENTLPASRTTLMRLAFLVFVILFAVALRQIYLFGLPLVFEPSLEKLQALKIESVLIEASWPLTPELVEKDLPKLVGKNILVVDPRTLHGSLMQKPWVKEVVVKKDYPNRLRIFVETKKPRAISLWQGSLYFIDSDGSRIEKVSPVLLKALDLPFLNFDPKEKEWEMEKIFHFYDVLKKTLSPQFSISQIVLGSYPHIKVFLAKPKIEITFSVENWESQLTPLMTLLTSPPSQIGQLQKINLVFPKKAIVSTPLSN